ncbi:MAG: nitrilase-related carbon-nitrogen hydrolase [bacterium]
MLKIAGIQMSCTEDKGANLEKATKLIRLTVEQDVKIACLPEAFNTHWFPKEKSDKNFQLAEKIGDLTISTMQKIAKELSVILICPFFEKTDNDYFYNSAAVIDDRGNLLGLYRKMHIPDIPLWYEKYYFRPGNLDFPVFKTKYGDIGIQICWDNFFPEGARILALKGAQLIFCPTAAAFASHKRWESVISANAIFNNIYFMRVNRVGSEERQDFYGSSFAVNTEGELISEPTGVTDSIVITNVDLDQIGNIRSTYPFLKDRRPDRYGETSK